MRKGKNFYTLWTEPPLPVPSTLVKPPVHDNRSSRRCPVNQNDMLGIGHEIKDDSQRVRQWP
jgi:hypothetical protein